MPFLSEGLSDHHRGVAVDDGARVWSYEILSTEAEKLGRRLADIGVGPGRLVAVAGGLNAEFLAALHGVWKTGAAVAPLDHRWTAPETDRAFRILSPDLLLLGVLTPDDPARLPSEHRGDTFRLDRGGPSGLPFLPDTGPPFKDLPGLTVESHAAHLLTSGTSGRPRVVRITCGNLRASAEGSRERLGLGPLDRWYASLSLSHVGGLALVTRAALMGSALVSRGPFDLPTFSALVEKGAVTHASLVPTMLHRALHSWAGKPPPPSLKCLLIGGAPAGDGLVREAVEAGFPIALTYGLTEASSQVATAPPWLVRKKPGTVGEPLPGTGVRVADNDELLVQGPTVAPGQAAEDGWLHTGDLARLDADGHLWIIGRRSDRIISGGENVDPGEVEGVLQSHPLVEEAVVVGIPDREWGERVVAVVVASSFGSPSEGELLARARGSLSPAKRPRVIQFLDTIPRNPNGKVDREKIRTLFR